MLSISGVEPCSSRQARTIYNIVTPTQLSKTIKVFVCLFYYPIQYMLLGMEWVYTHHDLPMFSPKWNEFE